MTQKTNRLLAISILAITISSVNQWSDLPIGNTFFWWVINSIIIISFFRSKNKYYDHSNDSNIITLKWYILWNLICIIRGCFVADNYWEWKNLTSTSLVMMLPLSIYVSTNPDLVQKITSFWLKYALPLFVLMLPFLQGEAIGRYLIPVSFILLFLPCFTTKWKIFLILIAIFVITSYLGARSNIVKFGVTILIGMLYYFRKLISVKLINFLRLILLLLPFIAVMLAVTNVFNIFQIGDYISGDYSTKSTVNGQSEDENLIIDTRTLLYIDVINSAQKYEYSWLGRTPARGNESTFFEFSGPNDDLYPRTERYSNEVSILNIFTWTGIVGVILYFLVFYYSSYLAIKKSKNNFMPLLGLYIAFRWCYAWVEDFNRIDLSNLYLWITIGMCYSKAFREKTDQEIKYWANGIVKLSARKLYVKRNKIATGNG